ncbi:MAG TPA: hypothetical protein VK896_01930 [Gaiellaceae bacterium]|nr:hypothetical protein [Gaiellaceae bacterium]
MPGEWSEGELLIAPEPRDGGRAAIRAALRQAAGRRRPGERTAWWREGIRANLRSELRPER